MTGTLFVVGIGPGDPDLLTPQAQSALETASDWFGYAPYLKRLEACSGKTLHASDNRQEINRAEAALGMAASGRRVALVSGGDPGVFAMAAAVCEAIERGPAEWRGVEITVVPGVTAMLAVAARAGAPLGHDFCAISLSDNLKPWPVVLRRLQMAAEAGFAIAIYNPSSRSRSWQLGEAFCRLREILPGSTPVIFGRAANRPDERITTVRLADADAADADMATCVIVGSRETRLIERPERPVLVYSPRSSSEARK